MSHGDPDDRKAVAATSDGPRREHRHSLAVEHSDITATRTTVKRWVRKAVFLRKMSPH